MTKHNPQAPAVIELEILLARCRACGLVLLKDGEQFYHPKNTKCCHSVVRYRTAGPVWAYPATGERKVKV